MTELTTIEGGKPKYYELPVNCNNCYFEGMAQFLKGTRVPNTMKCSNCECTCEFHIDHSRMERDRLGRLARSAAAGSVLGTYRT